jgi:membrane fusion protein, copper/silver efflux system
MSPDTIPPSPSRRGRQIALLVGVVAVLALGIAVGPWLTATVKHLTAGETAQAPAGTGTWYIDQMHPWIISPHPGTCPICGMDLVPVDPKRFAGEIGIDPVVVQNMGVRIAPVEQAAVTRSIRTVGTVAIDESLVTDVNLKIPGWIERLQVDTLWAPVRQGDPLFDIYAPDLYTAQQEYLLAIANRDGPRGTELLTAARTKLHFLDIGDAAIAALETSGVPARSMSITAPRSGVVAMKNVNTGTYAMPGMTTMRIADLSRVWIDAVLYEHQIDPAMIHVGQSASVVPAMSDAAPITASIDYVYPTIDPRLRELRVRLVVDNATGALKPGMFATVTITQTTAPQLLVPREAVVGTGARHVAFVSLGQGRFEPRTVSLGRATDDGRVPVLTGLAAGDQIVTSGQFLLDSESRMREGLAKVMGAGLAATPAAAPVMAADNALPAPAAAALPALLDAYLNVQQPLAEGQLASAQAAAKPLQVAAAAFRTAGESASPHFLHRFAEAEHLADLAAAIGVAQDLTATRVAFGRLSADLIELTQRTGVPAPYAGSLRHFTCGMFKAAPKGGLWIQRGEEAHNPFFGGTGMASCTSADGPLPAAAGASATGSAPAPMDMPAPAPAADPHAGHR